jgi:hypothetical protein
VILSLPTFFTSIELQKLITLSPLDGAFLLLGLVDFTESMQGTRVKRSIIRVEFDNGLFSGHGFLYSTGRGLFGDFTDIFECRSC